MDGWIYVCELKEKDQKLIVFICLIWREICDFEFFSVYVYRVSLLNGDDDGFYWSVF